MFYHILVLVGCLIWISCATPVGPDGGPRDQQGPVIISTSPETGTTNFNGDKITISFDEFVSRDNIRSNISIEPDIGIGYSVGWKRKDLILSFDSTLPDSTTVIFTLNAEISDTRGNKMGSPHTVAFSTGDDIDEGTLLGKILNADTGKGVDGATVLLYRLPAGLDERATYTARTDTGGVFSFKYLGEGVYRPIYVDDRNRNKTWDPEREEARPFYRPEITLDKAQSDTLRAIYISRPDTLQPALMGVGMLSTNRLRLRFSEAMDLQRNSRIILTDTTGADIRTLLPLYVDPDDPLILFAYSDSATSPKQQYSLRTEAITDRAGNPPKSTNLRFSGSAQDDTTYQRVIGQASPDGLFPSQPVEVVYADPIADPEITDSLVVAEGEVTFTDWPGIRIEGNRLYIHPQEETWLEGMDYQFLIWNPATRRRQLIDPEIWDLKELGAIEISVESADSNAITRGFLRAEQIDFESEFDISGLTTVDDLAPVAYTLFVFTDLNGNDTWDQGRVDPYESPEPYLIRRGIKVSAGFISEVFVEM